MFRGLNDEKTLVLALLLVLGFIYLSVSHEVGNILTILTVGYGFVVIFTKQPIQFIKKIDFTSLILIAAFSVLWIFLSYFIAVYIFNVESVFSFQSLLTHINSKTNVPVLSDNPFVRQLVWGTVFPAVETVGLLGLGMTIWSRLIRVNINNKLSFGRFFSSFKHIWLMLLVGVTCSLYHLVVRQGQDMALFSDFVFFSLSVPLTMMTGQLFEAFGLHFTINNLVLLMGGS